MRQLLLRMGVKDRLVVQDLGDVVPALLARDDVSRICPGSGASRS